MSEHPELTIWEHLEEFRSVLIRAFLSILIGIILCFTFSEELLNFLTEPAQVGAKRTLLEVSFEKKRITNQDSSPLFWKLPKKAKILSSSFPIPSGEFVSIPSKGEIEYEQEKEPFRLVLLSPLEGFTASLSVAFLGGILFSSPYWGWALLRFFSPALYPAEKALLLPFIAASILIQSLTFYVTWRWVLPLSNAFFYNFNTNLGENFWSFSEYLGFTLQLIFALLLTAEMGLLLLFAVKLGILTYEHLQKGRRYFILFSLIFGALLTPPDIPSQLMVAFPLMALYECALFYARFQRKISLTTDG